MKKIIPFKSAVTATIAILFLVTVFQLCVMVGLLPYDMVWGGRIKNSEEMVGLVMVSILINMFSATVVLIKANRFLPKLKSIANLLIFLLPVLYFFGIIGNAMSTSAIERAIFVPITIVLFILTLRIALEKNK